MYVKILHPPITKSFIILTSIHIKFNVIAIHMYILVTASRKILQLLFTFHKND